MGSLFHWIVFILTALTAIFAAVMVITRRNPIHSALFLVLNFLCIAVLYLLLNSQFIAIIQVMIYAGAIMMLVIFVIMLLSVEEERRTYKVRLSPAKVIGLVVALILFAELVYGIALRVLPGVKGEFTPEKIAQMGDIKAVASLLFTRFLFPFEVASILLLVGIIGAVILSKKER
ncbi:MAG: NADH-quinone oxidoreductase subunit J [Deltaproteobacteria bacterium]|nr:MAG: NADH-quinone oxidoreductase subunit J [Deltaproteobacteria bacterium]